MKGYRVYVGSLGRAEVDFVLEKSGEKKYIQVAYSVADARVMKREMAPFEQIRDAYEKTIITLDDISFGNHEGVRHLLAWELYKG